MNIYNVLKHEMAQVHIHNCITREKQQYIVILHFQFIDAERKYFITIL